MVKFNIAPLQWGAGCYCAFNGLLMLVTPHQFLSPAYAALHAQLWLWGLLLLLAGSLMLGVALLNLGGRVAIIAHVLAGASLLLLAAGFVTSQLWSGTINLTVLGLGTLISALQLDIFTRDPRRAAGDLLAFVVGLGMIANGLLMLLAPTQYSAPLYTPIRPLLAWFGLAFILCGSLLVYQQLRTGSQSADAFARIAQLLGGAVLFSFFPLVIISQVWSGIPYYGVIAILIVLAPWYGRIGWRIDGKALRARLALAMALVAAVPLILMTAWFSGRTEQEMRHDIMEDMQVLATSLASSVENYADEHRNAVITLAANPDLLEQSPARQRSLIQSAARAYPDIVAFSTYDPAGNPIARSDNLPLTALVPAVLADLRLHGRAINTVIMSPLLHRPIFVFAAPSARSAGSLGGYVLVAVESARISASLSQSYSSAGVIAYLVDSNGRVIAHPDQTLVAGFADLQATASVATFLQQPTSAGELSYGDPATERLAGYAGVPDMGWGVIVEQPVAIALAETRAAREQLLILTLAFLLAAALAGVLVARSLTAPLSDLVGATTALASDDQSAPLPASGIRELDRLAEAFGAMRASIAERTVERQQAQVALQALNDELESLVAQRTAALNQTNATLEQKARDLERSNVDLAQFAYVASHDLQEPLRMMASYSQLLARRYHGKLDEKADRYINYISEGAIRMKALIDDLLVYSREGHEASATALVSLEAALKQALLNLKLVAAENEATINHAPLPQTLGDITQLTSIFQNLIHNAIKFHGEEKPIINISASRRDECWVICVRDNGVGIEPQYLQRIFTIFQRLHTRQKYAGNGIGLALVKKMVEYQGGRIWVESQPGAGSAFFFTTQALKEPT